MSSEIGVVMAGLLLLAAAPPILGPAAVIAAASYGTARGARRLRGAARWLRANGLAADQLAALPLAPVNLTHMEFCTLAQACDLRVADVVRDTNFGLQMMPIATASGQSFGLVQVGQNWHLAGAQDLLQTPMAKVVPEMANFRQMVNVVAATKVMATKLGADLNTVQVRRDQTGTLYLDLNVPNPVKAYRPAELATSKAIVQAKAYKPVVKSPIDINGLANQIAAAEPIVGIQAYQKPPEGYLRVAMEVEPTGRMHVSVLGDHGYEDECLPVAEALEEAFANADVFCSLRSIGQAPPAPAGVAPLEDTLSADRPVQRPRQMQYGR